MKNWTRRTLLISGGIVGGGLALGVAEMVFAPARLGIGKLPGRESVSINTWVRHAPDGTVTVIVPHCDMGQGVYTALPMMLAEELEADWSKVRVEEAPATNEFANGYLIYMIAPGTTVAPPFLRGFDFATYKLTDVLNLQVTGGSSSVRSTGVHGMRVAGAAAKEMLIAAAARQWGVPPGQCIARLSVVHHEPSGRSVPFGALAYAAAALDPPTNPQLKPRKAYTIVGTPRLRFDIPAKVDGSAVYSIDVRLPGMLYAAIHAAPVTGSTLLSVDESPLQGRRGIKKVVKLPNAVAVVADNFWRAKTALDLLAPRFSEDVQVAASSDVMFDTFGKALTAEKGSASHKSGKGARALEGAKAIDAEYRVPFLAHATMEPMNCTAVVKDGGCEVFVGVQDPLGARKVAADAAGVPVDKTVLHNHPLGGGFGRKLPGYFDFVDQAVLVAKAMSPTPVKLVWTREEDMQHDFYRPAVLSRFKAALGQDGFPTVWFNNYSNKDGGAAHPPYAIKNQEIRERTSPFPVRTGPVRSVEFSQQGFFIESFIDELAHAAGKNPYAYRHALLKDKPRHQAVLQLAAEKSGFGAPALPGTGQGIAIVESFGTIVAQVADVAVDRAGVLKVNRIVAAVDCGDVVSPDGAKSQIEGGIVFGLSAALFGAITVDKSRVKESNFWDYEMARLIHTPQIEIHFIQSGAPLGGLGEPGVPPVAPAIANAVFAATGKRIRALPLKASDLTPLPEKLAAAPVQAEPAPAAGDAPL